MNEILKTAVLMLVLLNPFLLAIYLLDIMRRLDRAQFVAVLVRAGVIASVVFCAFAVAGDAAFSEVIQAEFASFQIFGGIVFLLIGLQFVFKGPESIEMLRGESEHLSGAVAMPVLIGPGTISASVVAGKRLDPLVACAVVAAAVAISLATILILKWVHDAVRPTRERLIERYVEIAGRIAALVVGTFSVEMIMKGVLTWIAKFPESATGG